MILRGTTILILIADIASLYTLNTIAIGLFTSMLVFLIVTIKRLR